MKTTINFSIPSNLLADLIKSMNALAFVPPSMEGSVRTVSVEHMCSKTVNAAMVSVSYAPENKEPIFKYKAILFIKNGEYAACHGEYHGTERDFRCGDIGMFDEAVITDTTIEQAVAANS